jgi:hypothetical protein
MIDSEYEIGKIEERLILKNVTCCRAIEGEGKEMLLGFCACVLCPKQYEWALWIDMYGLGYSYQKPCGLCFCTKQ